MSRIYTVQNLREALKELRGAVPLAVILTHNPKAKYFLSALHLKRVGRKNVLHLIAEPVSQDISEYGQAVGDTPQPFKRHGFLHTALCFDIA